MATCGTTAGYFVHRRRGETTCPECRQAMVRHVRKYRGKKDLCACGREKATSAGICHRCSSLAASKAAASARTAKHRAGAQLVHVGEVPFTWLPPQHPVMRRAKAAKNWWTMFVAGDCAWCGDYFVARSATGRERYCSEGCSKQAAKNRRGRFVINPRARVAIYERDAWVCQLCLEPVDSDLLTTDPFGHWAPSLDHIIPQSKGGTHDPENLRLAHRWCNSVRGDESYYTATDLRRTA